MSVCTEGWRTWNGKCPGYHEDVCVRAGSPISEFISALEPAGMILANIEAACAFRNICLKQNGVGWDGDCDIAVRIRKTAEAAARRERSLAKAVKRGE